MAWALTLAALSSSPMALAQSPEERTRQALEMILAGKYAAFYAQWSPEMTKGMSLETYSTQVAQVMTALGAPISQDPPETRRVGDAVTVTIPVHWAAATLNFIVSWNAAGKIQGTWFRPPETKAVHYETPAYSRPASFTSRDVTVRLR